MNLYTCLIDLHNEAKALVFAKAVSEWMTHLKTEGVIEDWQLYRRKLNLAADGYRDFMLHVEVQDLAQLDRAFRLSGRHDEAIEQLHRAVHSQILQSDFALYRPSPDDERSERMGLM